MKDIKFFSLFEKIPFVQNLPLSKKGVDVWKEWADIFNNPPEDWSVPPDRKSMRFHYDRMYDEGFSSVLDAWGEANGIHMHQRIISAVAVPYIIHIFGNEFTIPGRIASRSGHVGHVLTWEMIKFLIEENDIDVDFDEIDLTKPSAVEDTEDEVKHIFDGEIERYRSYSKTRLILTLRWRMVRAWIVTKMVNAALWMGKRISPEMFRHEKKKNDNDQG